MLVCCRHTHTPHSTHQTDSKREREIDAQHAHDHYHYLHRAPLNFELFTHAALSGIVTLLSASTTAAKLGRCLGSCAQQTRMIFCIGRGHVDEISGRTPSSRACVNWEMEMGYDSRSDGRQLNDSHQQNVQYCAWYQCHLMPNA